MDLYDFNAFDDSDNLPPADQESTEPNHNTDRNFQAAFLSLASLDPFDPHPLADYDINATWGNPVFGNAPDASSQGLSLADGAGTSTGGVNTNDSSASPSEHDVNRYMPAEQDYTGLQTSPHYYQQPSPSSNTPSMTDDSTRSSSNGPSTPGANELGALVPANAVAHGDAGILPAPPPPRYTQGSYDYDAVLCSLESPNVAPQGGAHRDSTRAQRRIEPYHTNQAAASGADLEHYNMTSTGAAPTGVARSNGAGGTTPSHSRTKTKKARSTAKKSSTTAEGPKWMCKVANCPGKRCKERGPNNEPLFASKQCFENHMKTHARDSMAAMDSKSAGDSDAAKGSVPVEGWKPEICPDCGKKLDSGRKDSLKRHIKTACKGKKDAEKKDASAPDEHPSNLHKHDDGHEDDDQGFGGMGGMPKGMPQQWASGQAGPSIW